MYSLGQDMIFAFANGPGSGNPSYVVATAGERQDLTESGLAIAAQRHCEVTHVHFGATAGQADVRFFTESGTIALCGHGMLAAAAWAARAGRAEQRLTLDHGSGSIALTMSEGGRYVGYDEQAGPTAAVEITPPLLNAIRLALGLHRLRNDDVCLWTGGNLRSKALLRLASPSLLSGLRLDPEARDRFCQQLQVTGIYPYVDMAAGRIRARHFPLYGGLNEDMATGNIAATVARHVLAGTGNSLAIEQGGAACNAASLLVEATADAWRVSGACRFAAA